MATSPTRTPRRLFTIAKHKSLEAVPETKRKRPSLLAYDVDEIPPLAIRASLSVQHVLAMSVGWIYVVVAVTGIGAHRSKPRA